MQTVKLSQDTRELLRTAAEINNSLKVEAGNVIKTINASGTVILEAEVAETFPETFSIYEMNRFLSVLNLANMKDADLVFSAQNFVDIRAGKASIKYKFASDNFVTHPGRQIQLPSEELVVDVSGEELTNVRKMGSALGHKILEFRVQAGKAFLSTVSPELGDASNDALIEIADAPDSPDGSYKIKFDNLILPSGDYQVAICARGITRWTHKTRKITVFIGLERA